MLNCLWCIFFYFFFNDTATTEIYTLSLHDALPISLREESQDLGKGQWLAGHRSRRAGRTVHLCRGAARAFVVGWVLSSQDKADQGDCTNRRDGDCCPWRAGEKCVRGGESEGCRRERDEPRKRGRFHDDDRRQTDRAARATNERCREIEGFLASRPQASTELVVDQFRLAAAGGFSGGATSKSWSQGPTTKDENGLEM